MPAPTRLSFGGPSASGLSPQLADAPSGLVPVAFQAGGMTDIDPNVLLAIAKVEAPSGAGAQGQPDELVRADVRATVDSAAENHAQMEHGRISLCDQL